MTRAKGKAAYMISAVAEQYAIHPQTLRLYEREGLLAPSRSEGNTRLYTHEDLERLEIILKLTRDLGVNLAGVEIILNMREKMEAMQKQVRPRASHYSWSPRTRGGAIVGLSRRRQHPGSVRRIQSCGCRFRPPPQKGTLGNVCVYSARSGWKLYLFRRLTETLSSGQ